MLNGPKAAFSTPDETTLSFIFILQTSSQSFLADWAELPTAFQQVGWLRWEKLPQDIRADKPQVVRAR